MIDYCSQCYDNLSTGDCLRLERLQRRAALTCTGAISRSATEKLFMMSAGLSCQTEESLFA